VPPLKREKIYTDLIEEVDEALRIRRLPPSSTGNASEATSQLHWIGVCGAPASGKSTLTQEVARRLNDKGISTVVIPMDGYHFYKHELDSMPDAQEMHARRGAPWTFNVRATIVEWVAYDFTCVTPKVLKRQHALSCSFCTQIDDLFLNRWHFFCNPTV
jgi:pantothenate kinase